jgi:hypothetical protein
LTQISKTQFKINVYKTMKCALQFAHNLAVQKRTMSYGQITTVMTKRNSGRNSVPTINVALANLAHSRANHNRRNEQYGHSAQPRIRNPPRVSHSRETTRRRPVLQHGQHGPSQVHIGHALLASDGSFRHCGLLFAKTQTRHREKPEHGTTIAPFHATKNPEMIKCVIWGSKSLYRIAESFKRNVIRVGSRPKCSRTASWIEQEDLYWGDATSKRLLRHHLSFLLQKLVLFPDKPA